MRVRDDVPETFAAEPAEFLASVPARGRAALIYTIVPRRRGTYALRRVDALVASRLGFWQRSVTWPAETESASIPTSARSPATPCWPAATS